MQKITPNTIQDVRKSPLLSIEKAEGKGYELIEELFVDSSGLGSESEPALTEGQLHSKSREITSAVSPEAVYTCITRQGQFQVYLGVFRKSIK